MLIRDARPADRDALRAVTLAAYGEYAAHMPPRHWQVYERNILATLEAVAPAEQLVALDGGAPIGTVLLYPAHAFDPTGAGALPAPVVRLLAVAPAARGRGVGAALMAECARRARRAGNRALALHTMDMMRAARRMYARLGYVRAPELDIEPLPGVTIPAYRLDLEADGR